MKKRFISLLLCLVLIFSLLPVSAFAAEAVHSGTDGDISWSLDADGTLFISGTGAMPSYEPSFDEEDVPSTAPWAKYSLLIESVVVESGVTVIGDYAFYRCRSLTSVTLPEGLTGIGMYAFSGDEGIVSIELPSGLNEIGDSAFMECMGLTSITIPEGVTELGAYAFESCTALTDIRLPKSLVRLGDGALSGCIAFTAITLPENVSVIGSYALAGCENLACVELPSGAEYIGESAFSYCIALESVTIPEKVTEIGQGAFGGCFALESIQVADGNTSFCSVDGVLFSKDRTMLACCPAGRSGEYAVPQGVTGFMGGAFMDCANLTSVIIPEGVESLEESLFYECTGLRTVTVPGSVTAINNDAFLGCMSLESFIVADSSADYSSVEGILTNKAGTELICCPAGKSGELTIPAGITTIGMGAFQDCQQLTGVTIPQGVTTIGEFAFMGCTGLLSIEIAPSVTVVDSFAFSYCESLESLSLPEGITEVADYLCNGCENLISVSIPEGVTRIGGSAFSECKSLASIVIPDGVEMIDGLAFLGSGLSYVFIPGSVTTILDLSFEQCNDLSEIHFGGSEEEWSRIDFGESNDSLLSMTVHFNAVPQPPEPVKVKVTRLAGETRTETAAMIARKTYDWAETVVLASGESYADALAGVPLAYALGAPILLVSGRMDAATKAELEALGASSVVILGGPAAVSESVENELKASYNVERIAGETRYETAVRIAEALEKINGRSTEAFIACAENYPDALAISAVAALKGAPVLYASQNGSLKATADYLRSSDVFSVTIVGGESAVPATAEKAIRGLVREEADIMRVYGDDRYATCIAINEEYEYVFDSREICVTTGLNFPDALAGGVYAAAKAAPMLLVKNALTAGQRDYLGTRNVRRVTVFGGQNAVSDALVESVTDILG